MMTNIFSESMPDMMPPIGDNIYIQMREREREGKRKKEMSVKREQSSYFTFILDGSLCSFRNISVNCFQFAIEYIDQNECKYTKKNGINYT